jgi:TetR/AcrR family transcriptional regulator of autoinduction and epiphytic fitness
MAPRGPTHVSAAPPRVDGKRAAIVRAALVEFQANGYDRTSMDQIASRADVSKRTVYNHFASKDELFRAIVETLTDRLGSAGEFHFDAAIDLGAQLERIGTKILDVIASDDFVSLARVVLSRFLQSPELVASIQKGHRPFHLAFARWTEAAAAAGMLRVEDPELAARQFGALLNASAFWPQVLAGRPPLAPDERERLLRASVSLFLDHYARKPR